VDDMKNMKKTKRVLALGVMATLVVTSLLLEKRRK